MTTTSIYGLPLTPAGLADEKGSTVIVQECKNGDWLEKMLRPLCTALGCSAGKRLALYVGVVSLHEFDAVRAWKGPGMDKLESANHLRIEGMHSLY